MIVNKYNLFVDSNKSPIDAYIKTKDKIYVNEEWETSKDISEAYEFIKKKGMPNSISITSKDESLVEYCILKELDITSKILIHG
jgi:hypothetical protein